ncbi:hypothetical protein RSal33209_3075 [Renibacterium salmoninarum ATCC 33209]|uniref:DUF8083 domain-containing protein n=1 Tax=Renibacterium salmoninarum (strain ATCC 33209 / DSM 20767 / JCM 11484 / NBRC 15589 / NCIMB 2235) TaxID=288705 RepID=A9WUC5_RENSM|nr:hypothetical protein [Renibacterium salmoninarum]ABY24796.1 hypothetical protein RSal33209_3075 [Renibacterium salmoninarum ATCC 33209]
MSGELYLGHSNLPFLSALRLYLPLTEFTDVEQTLIERSAPPSEDRMYADLRELNDSLGRVVRAGPSTLPTAAAERFRSLQMVEDGPVLYSLNQVHFRSAKAVEAFRDGPNNRLAEWLFSAKVVEEMHELAATERRVLTRTSTWGIPFSWFVLISESDRTEVVESRSRVITVRVQVPLATAKQRLVSGIANLEVAAPELDLLDELRELHDWLATVPELAVVELDYGAIADRIYPDESPMDVRLGLECIAEGDLTGAAAAYRRLASRWILIRQLARAS